MFTKEVVGTANALVGGWGNLGGGVTQIVMGTCLYPLFQLGMSADMAWRTVCICLLLLHSVAEFYSFVFQMMHQKGTIAR